MFSKNKKKSLQFFSIVELILVTLFTHIPSCITNVNAFKHKLQA